MRGALLLALAGCGGNVPTELGGVRVDAARLEKLSLGGGQALVGGWAGGADLVVTSGETEIRVPVDITAASLGLVLELGGSPGGKVELGLPRGPLRGDDLFGTYSGVRESLVVLVGATGLHLQNEAGVRIDDTAFGLGLGLSVAGTWLTISAPGDAPLTTTTTSTPPTATPPTDTGGVGTEDTGRADPGDSGSDGEGCNCTLRGLCPRYPRRGEPPRTPLQLLGTGYFVPGFLRNCDHAAGAPGWLVLALFALRRRR